MTPSPSDKVARPMSARKIALASSIGACIEWYDFFLYGTVASLIFNKLFFPSYDPLTGTMLAYGTFGVAYLSRPLGGVIFGHFGDTIGRKKMLVLTLFVMGIGTFLIGFLPTYDSIGIWAPILLLLLRVGQGLGLGGEWGGAMLMAVEHSPDKNVGWYGSWPQMGAPAGMLLGTGVVSLMSKLLPEAQFLSWGWRLPFMLSALLVVIGLYIRLNILETPAFTRVQQEEAQARVPIMDVLTKYPINTILGMLTRWTEGLHWAVYTVFIMGYLTTIMKLPRHVALNSVTLACLVMMVAFLMWGKLADRYGRRATYRASAILAALTVPPSFWVLSTMTENTLAVTLAIVIPFGLVGSGLQALEGTLFAELFDARVRYTGMSLVFQGSGIFSSGLTPLIAMYLLELNGNQPWYVVVYMLIVCVISVIAVTKVKLYDLGEKAAPQSPSHS